MRPKVHDSYDLYALDVLVARKRLDLDVATQGKATLVRVVSTLTKLIERHLRDAETSTSTSTTGNGARH
jgi:hypothetical protein